MVDSATSNISVSVRWAQTDTHRRPPGATMLCRLANAVAASSKNMTPKRDSTTSKGAPPVCQVWASATTHSTGAASAVMGRADAAAIISDDTSAATTLPWVPTSAAAARVDGPVPHPTSSTRSPGCRAAAASNRSSTATN